MDYAVGDVHGCLDKLLRLLDVLNYDPAEDRLIFLGDYIDRGPDSKGVVDLLLRLRYENSDNIFLMGNHEDNFLTYVHACTTGEQDSYWLSEPFFAGGGVTTLQSYHPTLRHPTNPRLIGRSPTSTCNLWRSCHCTGKMTPICSFMPVSVRVFHWSGNTKMTCYEYVDLFCLPRMV